MNILKIIFKIYQQKKTKTKIMKKKSRKIITQ